MHRTEGDGLQDVGHWGDEQLAGGPEEELDEELDEAPDEDEGCESSGRGHDR